METGRTEEELLKKLEYGIDSYALDVVKDPNATRKVYEKAIKTIRRESTLLDILRVIEQQGLDEALFKNIFEQEKELLTNTNTHELKKIIINHPFFTKEMFDYYAENIEVLVSYEEFIKTLITSKYADEESYIKIINTVTYTKNKVYKMLLDSPKVTDKALEEITKKYLTEEEIYYMIIKHEKVTSNILCSLLDTISTLKYNTKPEKLITTILESKAVNEEVLIKIVSKIEKIFKYYNENQLAKIVEQVLSSDKVTTNVFKSILSSFLKNEYVYQLILQDQRATKEIKISVFHNMTSLTQEDIDVFFNIKGITEDNLINLLNKHQKNQKLLEKAIDFPLASKKLYNELVKILFSTNNDINYSVYPYGTLNNRQQNTNNKDLIIKLLTKDLEETTLLEILKQTKDIDIITSIVNHPNANLKVVAKVNILSDEYRENEKNQLLELSSQLKKKIIENTYQIEQEENVTEILRMNVEDRLSTMLWGPSGVGKSSRVFEIDPTATMLILKNGMLPEEVIGGKEPNGEPGEIYPPHWYQVLKRKCEAEPERMHILFIDEITNVNDTIKNLVWEIVGCRLVNGREEWPLPENCAIVAAGNRPEESSAVRIDASGGAMPAPLHNRFDSMIEIQFDIDEWQKWALETDPKTGNLRMHPIVYSFCIAHYEKVMFTQFNPDEITEPFLTPRKWKTLSDAIYKTEARGSNRHISYARIKSIIGTSEITNAFIEHYERIAIDMNKIISGKYSEEDFVTSEDKLYALGMIIANYEGDYITIESFILECLGEEYLEIYNNMKNVRSAVLKAR